MSFGDSLLGVAACAISPHQDQLARHPAVPRISLGKPPATQRSVLDEASSIIDGDREGTHGEPGKNLRTIAELWDVWLRARGITKPGAPALTESDVCMLMNLLKTARLANNITHHDSQVDLCGYTRLMQRVQQSNSDAAKTLHRSNE